MQTITQFIATLRAQGLSEYEILAQLDAAKKQLALVSGPEMLEKLRAINPAYTKSAVHKRIVRNYADRAHKFGNTWYIDQDAAAEWLEEARNKPANW